MANTNQPENMLYGTMKHLNDIHFWVVLDNEIVDPYFPIYDGIKSFQGLEGNPVYEEFPVEVQKKLWAYHWKKIVKPALKTNSVKEIKKIVEKPISSLCMLNAYCYRTYHKKGRIAVGRMGWKKKNSNEIFWEYG
jgi:hypothetical protein